jgi:high-affinity Fe2+/Pb2+ permease
LIAYVAFSDENKSNRVKWAWLGVLASLVLAIILIAIVFKSNT